VFDGLLLIDKPSGWTSFDVVAKVRGIVKRETGLKKPKVGHTGTLDPLATGLLVLTVGSYCKRAQEFSKLDKVYDVTMKLGLTSTTGDAEGVITRFNPVTGLNLVKTDKSRLEAVVEEFVGEIMQTPPAYSAIKVNGQRAYKLARAGQEVVLEPRQTTIYSIDNLEYTYPEIRFTTKVSSGTYVRSLVEDIGKALDTGAYMTALRRRTIGEFTDENMLQISELQDVDKHLIQIPDVKS